MNIVMPIYLLKDNGSFFNGECSKVSYLSPHSIARAITNSTP